MLATLTISEPAFEVREVCAVLGVSASVYYSHRCKATRLRRQEDEVLTQAMKQAFVDNRYSYGSPRLVIALRKQGLRTSKTRVRRLMKRAGVSPTQKRREPKSIQTTQSHPHLTVAPHLLRDVPPARQPGERFHSNITYIPTQEGWLYLAATIDAYSRRCAGWSADDNMETPLVLRAARHALATSKSQACLHHSERGSQYASEPFRSFLAETEVIQSMSRRGNCYDNAVIESFWATLKTECFNNFREGLPATRQQAQEQIFHYIELFYNRKRLHSSLGYCSPVEFERNYFQHKHSNLPLTVST